MRKLLIICSLVVLLIGATVFNAGAALITGDVAFSGKGMDGGSLATATQISFVDMVVNAGATGSFAGSTGLPVTVLPLTFKPIFTPNNPFWSFTMGGTTFSLDALTATVQAANANFLNILGTGTLHGTGFTDTPYFYSVTATDSAGTGLAISAGISNNPSGVPVPPSLVMLSSGLIGLAVIRRKFRG